MPDLTKERRRRDLYAASTIHALASNDPTVEDTAYPDTAHRYRSDRLDLLAAAVLAHASDADLKALEARLAARRAPAEPEQPTDDGGGRRTLILDEDAREAVARLALADTARCTGSCSDFGSIHLRQCVPDGHTLAKVLGW